MARDQNVGRPVCAKQGNHLNTQASSLYDSCDCELFIDPLQEPLKDPLQGCLEGSLKGTP